ncbi:MAG: hypothetical protein IJQ67_00715 [Bacilli bacterium]|nr:hypothetical protein [Methanobrevibacter sp.]MBQ6629750.1 hypothetical protein [Methanobrevibacter sp.]MBR0294412.1 hypothetical protein [Bacilli bacterium]
MNYIVVEKEDISLYSHRYCNPSIIIADNEKDAEFFYNHEYYVGESRTIATVSKHTDINGLYIIITPISDFWKSQIKTIQALFSDYIEKYDKRVRYIIKR